MEDKRNRGPIIVWISACWFTAELSLAKLPAGDSSRPSYRFCFSAVCYKISGGNIWGDFRCLIEYSQQQIVAQKCFFLVK